VRGVQSRIQQVFRDHFDAYRAERVLPGHVIRAGLEIASCRTSARGYHLLACPDGHFRRRVFNACRQRNCPACGFMQTERWVRKQAGKLVDCDYHHIIFTTAHEVNGLWRYNRELFVTLLFRATWQTLSELLADPKYLGALPGALAAVHTWQARMLEHVHLHVLCTAGGMTAEGEWREPVRRCLLPQAVVARKFRGKLLAMLREALREGELRLPPQLSAQRCMTILNRLDKRRKASKKWHVQVMPRYPHGKGVVLYLGRYLRGGPVRDGAVLGYDGQSITLRDKHGERFTLAAGEFLRRFLAHVPPPRMHTTRAYGLFHHARRPLLDQARARVGQLPYDPGDPCWQELCEAVHADRPPRCCPACGQPLIRIDPFRRRSGPRRRGPQRNHSPPHASRAA
jgi:hypothetical protein